MLTSKIFLKFFWSVEFLNLGPTDLVLHMRVCYMRIRVQILVLPYTLRNVFSSKLGMVIFISGRLNILIKPLEKLLAHFPPDILATN